MTDTTTAPWVSIVYLQGDEADEWLRRLYEVDGVVWSGPYAESIDSVVHGLAAWEQGEESEHTPRDDEPWGSDDRTAIVRHAAHGTEYVLAWNVGLTSISLNRRVGA